jgi:hypothetical protein
MEKRSVFLFPILVVYVPFCTKNPQPAQETRPKSREHSPAYKY